MLSAAGDLNQGLVRETVLGKVVRLAARDEFLGTLSLDSPLPLKKREFFIEYLPRTIATMLRRILLKLPKRVLGKFRKAAP